MRANRRKHWVGYYANRYAHLGNRSTNRVEGAHAAIKTALGKVSYDHDKYRSIDNFLK
ncbi:uncharacterized protein RHIMIDRAFT_274254 [Rhizopus microsporus ATCC 52813]|uniref:Uncharacterized protein n=1 Tax=Rhizopus microsporus ATCC 52813 TaxID=1340429 RepID=A0A2G4SFW8_RHIZD|nr:uncharacterized protein RHIMIDRAFT_274254 [Rhizopus microsporus ATCC 52813]PHZ07663.1 hypothetical protein RHIMIDRAFT_274254 [Rhizopus microsporus ATCC 52813]